MMEVLKMNNLNTTRHDLVFSATAFGDKRIDVIGAGATGSRIALSLAKLGVSNLHVWDFDSVESHNIANQAFRLQDIGKLKVEALAEIVKELTGISIVQHNEMVDGSQKLGEIVFVLTDTMASRKEIFEKGLKLKPWTKVFFETRMGVSDYRIYSINPLKPAEYKAYDGTLYADEAAEVSACGSKISVGPTAEAVSAAAVWQFILWNKIQNGEEVEDFFNEIIYGFNPVCVFTNKF